MTHEQIRVTRMLDRGFRISVYPGNNPPEVIHISFSAAQRLASILDGMCLRSLETEVICRWERRE
jgi:hypothetical protein